MQTEGMSELIDEQLSASIQTLSDWLVSANCRIATVESCTGGRVASLFTAFPGSSVWFDRAFVTYTNQSKVEMVGVNPATLGKHGAVSEQVACEMAQGGQNNSEAEYSISITGIAGPGGGSESKPVGMVCFAWSGFDDAVLSSTQYFKGDRGCVRMQSVRYVIEKSIKLLKSTL